MLGLLDFAVLGLLDSLQPTGARSDSPPGAGREGRGGRARGANPGRGPLARRGARACGASAGRRGRGWRRIRHGVLLDVQIATRVGLRCDFFAI